MTTYEKWLIIEDAKSLIRDNKECCCVSIHCSSFYILGEDVSYYEIADLEKEFRDFIDPKRDNGKPIPSFDRWWPENDYMSRLIALDLFSYYLAEQISGPEDYTNAP